DPDAVPVRLLLLAIMLASLFLAVAIPDAFGERALLFAGSYVAIQVGRHLFLTFVVADRGTIERERAAHILIWFVAAGVLWIAGAVADDARSLLWLVALAIDYVAPMVMFRLPGRSLQSTAWTVQTSHFAERFQLFVIIALGETIVLTGATTAKLPLDTARVTAFCLAFVSTAALWWLYFTYVATIAERRLELADADRTRLARDGYTYLHVVLVAGIILSAVGDEIVIAHPADVLPGAEVAAVVAGPALYLIGHCLFRLRLTGSVSWKRLGGAVACLAVGALGPIAPALALAALLVSILVAVILLEQAAAWRRSRRGDPSPLERLAIHSQE
ncbi:MAG: low temperature requirement protein A, partial [Acidobacteria bacterium]|nr:low temperature requirement protein A [Acidobacteriota bacterium]